MSALGRIGAIGDIHAEDDRLARALAHLEDLKVDAIVAVGDIVDGKGDSARCCKLLAESHVITVRGNHDRWLLSGTARDLSDALQLDELDPAQHRYLASLPVTRELNTVAGRLLLCHGLGANDMLKVLPDDFGYALESNEILQSLLSDGHIRFVVNGHSHQRMVRDFGGLTIINCGTLYRDHAPCFVVADFEIGEAHFYDLEPGGAITKSRTYPLGSAA